MQAVVKSRAEPGLWLEEVPVPKIKGDDILIRVVKTSICGTDVHIYNWDEWAQKTIPVPMTIGHEFVGVVDHAGDHVKGFATGELGSIHEGPAVGDLAPEFRLRTQDGDQEYRLSQFRGRKPVVLIFGSFT